MFRSAALFGIVIAALALFAVFIALPVRGSASVSGDNTGQAQLTVTKVYDMACECTPPPGDIPVDVTCTLGATASNAQGSDGTISNTHGATFDITGAQLSTTCTATETPGPDGFIQDNAPCTDKPVPPEANATCQITNHQTYVYFNVAKDFTDNNPSTVSVTVTCTSGDTETNPKNVSESQSTNFYITGFDPGATCNATEDTPPGYEGDLADCTDVSITSSQEGIGCTITNHTVTTVVVGKDFSDNNPASVSILLSCSGEGTVEQPNPASATEAEPAEFVVQDVGQGTSCSASEAHVHGYTTDASNCSEILLGVTKIDQFAEPDCVITNTLNSITFDVYKSYPGLQCAGSVVQVELPFDPCTDSVTITLTCTDGDVTTIDGTARPFSPAEFTVSGFDPSPPADATPTCTATETVPPGYTGDNTQCQDVPLVLIQADGIGGQEQPPNSCTIFNTQNFDQVTVYKDFTDNNPETVTISLECTSGEVTSEDQTAADTVPPDAAHFQVTGFDTEATCVAHEDPIPEGYTQDNSDCNPISLSPLLDLSAQGQEVPPGESCTITNTPSAEPWMTPTALPTAIAAESASPTASPTPSPTPSPTIAPTNAPTNSPTPTPTHPATATPTITPITGPFTETPAPTASPTPICQVVLTQPAEPGQTEIFVSITTACDVGEWVTIDPGAGNAEDGHVVGRGSLILECPVKLHHNVGEVVTTIPGPVPGCASSTPARLPNTGGPPTSSGQNMLLLFGGLALVLAAFLVAQRKAR